jgi:hypothetical protein
LDVIVSDPPINAVIASEQHFSMQKKWNEVIANSAFRGIKQSSNQGRHCESRIHHSKNKADY